MNKSGFIEELKNRTKLNDEECVLVNDIIENNFIIGKNNKEIIVNEIKEKLSIDIVEAEKVYEMTKDILLEEIKNKIKHPFKSKD